MLRISVLLALSTTIAFPAWADPAAGAKDWTPVFVATAPKDKFKAAFPKSATMTGEVTLGCVAAAGGKLADCTVAKETPTGQGFGAAALSLVGYERIKSTDETGASVVGRPVQTQFTFLAPGDSNPDWLKKPTGDAIANVYPRKAIDKGLAGSATINCKVTVEGFLELCKVVSEAPAGLDFGAAGLQLAPQLRMTPKVRGGKPVPGGEVTIPINWERPHTSVGTQSSPLVLDPPWIRVPSQAEIKAAWPKEAAGVDSGQAALRCYLTGAGDLRDCEVISEIPKDKGFGKAAKALSKSFRVTPDAADPKALKKYAVDLPIRFRDPALPDARTLTRPKWIQTLTAGGMAVIYPQAALTAKVYAGVGAVTCAITLAGELSECQIAREEPKGLGFGEAAIKAMAMMRMNPWTKEGDSVEGLKVTIPIAFRFEGDAAPERQAN